MRILNLAESINAAYCNEEWLENYDSERHRKRNLDLILEARTSVLILTGELDPAFYEREMFLYVLRTKLNEGISFEAVFHKGANTKEQAKKELLIQNPSLITTLQDQRGFSSFDFYWAPRRPRIHYTIIDDNSIFLEYPHLPKEQRHVLIAHNPYLAKHYRDEYNKFKENEGLVKIEWI